MTCSGLVLQDDVIGTTDMKANDGAARKHEKKFDGWSDYHSLPFCVHPDFADMKPPSAYLLDSGYWL